MVFPVCMIDQFDMRVPEKFCKKVTDCRKKNDGLDAKDAKKATETDKNVQAKKDATIKEKAAADAAGMNTVGADRKDSKSLSAANRAAGLGCFQSNSYGGTRFVDATTA